LLLPSSASAPAFLHLSLAQRSSRIVSEPCHQENLDLFAADLIRHEQPEHAFALGQGAPTLCLIPAVAPPNLDYHTGAKRNNPTHTCLSTFFFAKSRRWGGNFDTVSRSQAPRRRCARGHLLNQGRRGLRRFKNPIWSSLESSKVHSSITPRPRDCHMPSGRTSRASRILARVLRRLRAPLIDFIPSIRRGDYYLPTDLTDSWVLLLISYHNCKSTSSNSAFSQSLHSSPASHPFSD
jgi:hypothetical protein